MKLVLPSEGLGRRTGGCWKDLEGYRNEQIMVQNFHWDQSIDLEGVGRSWKGLEGELEGVGRLQI